MQNSQHNRIRLTGANGQRLRSALIAALSLAVIMAISASCLAFIRQDDSEGVRSCQSNLKQYTLGLLMYCQDYDETFPPMKFPAQVQHRVDPYIKNRSVYSCPVTSTDYLTNPAMNYLTLDKVKAPSTMLVLRDAKPHTTESSKPGWNAAYLDGHVKLVMTEPPLGKPAPTPLPLTRAQQVRAELKSLRQQRRDLDARIRQLEKEERRLSRQ